MPESLDPNPQTQAEETASNTPNQVTASTETEPPAGEQNDAARLVPVTESIRYRKRAQSAEAQSQALQKRVDELTRTLSESEQTIAALERRQRIDAELAEAEAVDLEVARLLTEAAVSAMDEPDIGEAVEDLRRHKPYLFRPVGRAARAMGPSPDDLASPLDDAAERAIASGDRRDLLRYLRLRRGH